MVFRNERIKWVLILHTILKLTIQTNFLLPVLFTIFINDLPEAIKVNCKVFADDTKIYDNAKNHSQIQKDLYTMQKNGRKHGIYTFFLFLV